MKLPWDDEENKDFWEGFADGFWKGNLFGAIIFILFTLFEKFVV
jgi:hypothetical protein